MGRDEQKEEREVLESIFPDEITGEACTISEYRGSTHCVTDISDTAYRISVALDITHQDGDDSEQRMLPSLRLCTIDN